MGVAATWFGVLFAYDSYYWFPSSQGLPVSFFIVSLDLSGVPGLGTVAPRAGARHSHSTCGRETRGNGALMFSGFMVNAWEIGTIVAVVGGVVGFFVVLRGAAFPAHAIPNGAFAGAAGANLMGINPLIGLGRLLARRRPRHRATDSRRGRADAVTALALVMMLAFGAAFLSQSTEYEPEIFSLLFGEILGREPRTDRAGRRCSERSACSFVGVLYRRLLLTSLAPEIAAAQGLRPELVETAFLVVIACATTMTVPVVGALLIFTLMIGPPAAARCFTDRARDRPGRSRFSSPLVTIWAALACSFTTQLAGRLLRQRLQRRLVRRRARVRGVASLRLVAQVGPRGTPAVGV